MKNLIKRVHFALYILLTLVLAMGCNNCEPETTPVPERPLFIIEITSVEQRPGTFAYKYKLVDKNGYVFYITESARYNGQPKRMLGDTIK